MTILQNGSPLISFGINDGFQIEDAIKKYVEEYAMPSDAKYTHILTDLIDTPINLVRYNQEILADQREKANDAYFLLVKQRNLSPLTSSWKVDENNVWRMTIHCDGKERVFTVQFKLNTAELALTTLD